MKNNIATCNSDDRRWPFELRIFLGSIDPQ